MYPLGLFFSATSIPLEIVLPNLPTITRKEVYGKSEKQAIFHDFFDAVSLIGDANISGVIAPVTAVACTRIYRILHRKKIREEEERIRAQNEYVQNIFRRIEQIRDSCLWGQACYNACVSNLYNRVSGIGPPIYSCLNSPVLHIEEAEYQLKLILEKAETEGKTVSSDIFDEMR